jgi:hypothetical protein
MSAFDPKQTFRLEVKYVRQSARMKAPTFYCIRAIIISSPLYVGGSTTPNGASITAVREAPRGVLKHGYSLMTKR